MSLLNFDQVNGTRAIPYAYYGGKVYSFKTANSGDRAFDGERLRIGLDGNVYAVFADSGEAAQHEGYFMNCAPASFGQHDNAFDLGRPIGAYPAHAFDEPSWDWD